MSEIKLYSKPDCVQCEATKRLFKSLDLTYITYDVSEDPDALAYVLGLGYLAAPVVVVGDDHWSGFQPDKIKGLVA